MKTAYKNIYKINFNIQISIFWTFESKNHFFLNKNMLKFLYLLIATASVES
ncbi:hypothetical protein IK5_06275 [Bacillus cereus VD154]|uniref:Uncharacterized protein n=1 Tax=Bacillus cereus VD154 TaxID=1053238 RepID=A0A9W5NZ74_BACCE|nr:hypothetical protein IK5_06275 [Bacillus cereus VD154]